MHESELLLKIGFVVSSSRISVEKVIKLYHHKAEIENRIKEGKNTLRWDKTSCHRFESNEARLKMGLLAYNLLHLLRKFYIRGEGVRHSVEWMIRRMINECEVLIPCQTLAGAGYVCLSIKASLPCSD